MSIKKTIAFVLATIMLSGIFISSASACVHPKPKVQFIVVPHGDGTVWIIVLGYSTFGGSQLKCGCALSLPKDIGTIAWAKLVTNDVNETELIRFEPNKNTVFDSSPQQGVATTEPFNAKEGISSKFHFHVDLKDGKNATDVRRALSGNSIFTDAVSGTGVPTNKHLGKGNLLVELDSFTANVQDNGDVSFNWKTASESSSAGFHVWQGKIINAQPITDTLISATGSATVGAEYSFTSTTASSGGLYIYALEEIDTDGTSRFFLEDIQVINDTVQ
jgi:hypothetical protein